ncbi:AI-2E family transporter [Qipengyuania aquimaris]|uniref:AI-2E family transporter n=1 Tax=Qipengyuania aquimaris TaxID=255984 RepID=A0A9Q3XDY4_9SPHN|nr:AI-2E family transporter [Qipengyuania aquimaris]MBY6127528.1 AI-2E family transporter [Qipengyuania aquimaris]MBY6218934.1 AI-2E family transporter [Qipengyuania aquimaris]
MEHLGKTRIEQGGFLLFLALVSLAALVVVLPFLNPLLWATLAAIMFQPLFRWFQAKRPGKDTQAALLTLLVIFIAVIIPALWIGSAVVSEAARLVVAFQQGQINIGDWFEQVFGLLPASLQASLTESGLGDFPALLERAQAFLQASLGLIAQQAIAIGGSVFGFVLAFAIGLYVSFFLIRDGRNIGETVLHALPMERGVADRLAERFIGIVRATIKGSVVVGLVQGALGAITFWIVGIPSVLLLGVIMAIASLLPAIGPAIVWGPAALYLLATGAIWEGVVVLISGVAVIGMADNILRPILVGRDTGIPDWLILITTLGGIALMGLSGIVVGPLVAGLFIAGWSILAEQRDEVEA